MQHDPARIKYLLERYAAKSCTREELDELFAVIREMPAEETLHAFMEEQYMLLHTNGSLPEVDYEQVYRNIVQHTPARGMKIFTFGKVAAAAAIILLAGAAVIWQSQRKQTLPSSPITAQLPKTDIAPGGTKATLTLADGTTVTLDSAGNQVISSGSTTITRHQGQLLYDAGKETAALQYNTLSTPRGGQFRVVLPDGSKVWLNSASSLRYPLAFTGKERVVELDGQGYFEVAGDAEQPFKVKVRSMEVRVLGTHFDVMAYKDENTVNTTLLEGAVQVTEGAAKQLLKPGQQAVLDTRSHEMLVQQANVNKVIAWKNGLFVFNNMTLPAILREVARWYDVEIVYQTTPSTELYGGGIARSLHLSNVLALLEAGGSNHFKIEGRKIIVLP
ncbi:FecR family protein [Chitinophaga sp. GCM10012297]|uniref:FecR domain-containing protein n=1 Tax=Chitinophaga chungangae TaxID=2821488 RepID=A0ABS3YF80_9BACT|nr:FecR family protein [Chitinophaga chungangae]MBO9153347.1 FecR domain-containing protein [Chitinophaga chungangae]